MAEKRNLRLTLAYDGKAYHGWQRQSNGITIQEVLEERIKRIINEPVKLIGSGRTDAGVHALNQVCNFISECRIDPKSLQKGLNSMLPNDIIVKICEDVPLEFHSRYDAKGKIYEYRILNRKDPDIFKREYAWHIKEPLNTSVMEECLNFLIGKHDFTSFKSTGSANQNPVREITRAKLIFPGEGMIHIIFEADGFLRHMVRNIVGTIVHAGLGHISHTECSMIMQKKDRQMAGIKAPARGLFLMEVKY